MSHSATSCHLQGYGVVDRPQDACECDIDHHLIPESQLDSAVKKARVAEPDGCRSAKEESGTADAEPTVGRDG